MSQAGSLGGGGGPLPPDVPQQFTVDVDGPAIADNNNIDLFGAQSSDHVDHGIQTVNDPSGSDTIYFQLTNRLTGQLTTADATPTSIITLAMGAQDAVYSVQGFVTALRSDTGEGASYDFMGCFKTDGATCSEVGTDYPTTFEDAGLAAADLLVECSANNIILEVIGIAGVNVSWDAFLTYRRVV
jgi:hypothetical protein